MKKFIIAKSMLAIGVNSFLFFSTIKNDRILEKKFEQLPEEKKEYYHKMNKELGSVSYTSNPIMNKMYIDSYMAEHPIPKYSTGCKL